MLARLLSICYNMSLITAVTNCVFQAFGFMDKGQQPLRGLPTSLSDEKLSSLADE
jgi:hypothetical protein